MQATRPKSESVKQAPHETVVAALEELDAILPGQAPIHDFVHHNTLHGFQHLPFEVALDKFQALTGVCGYLPEKDSRSFYHQGRINDEDLTAALTGNPALQCLQPVCDLDGKPITRQAVYSVALLFDLCPIHESQFNWLCEEMDVLNTFQTDVPEAIRRQLVSGYSSKINPVNALWQALLAMLDLQPTSLHPENMLDLSAELTEDWLVSALPGQDNQWQQLHSASIRQQSLQQAGHILDERLGQVGDTLTLRGFISALSGIDILDWVRPQLTRLCASAMDEGVAAWQIPGHNELGFYASWRAGMLYDANPFFHELPDWLQIITSLPDNAIDTIILQLTQLAIPQKQWAGYLRQLALELPGWSGLINWRQQHPNYRKANNTAPSLADYLAIRLTLDRLWLNQICRDIWHIEATLGSLESYFRKNLPEFIVRHSLHQRKLPEYLAERAESLSMQANAERYNRQAWQDLADQIWTWQSSPMTDNLQDISIFNTGWRLFRLFQHLGISASQLQQLTKQDLKQFIVILDDFNETERQKIWLTAYEHHYRSRFLKALKANHNRGRWARREQRPSAQIVFCMDDREESFRRHWEELNPTIETLGAAGFFGIAMNYLGLDDSTPSALCPVVVIPAHNVREIPQDGEEQTVIRHNLSRKLFKAMRYFWHQEFRRRLISSFSAVNLLAPLTLINLLAKSWLPKLQHSLLAKSVHWLSASPKTRLDFAAPNPVTPASSMNPQQGFTVYEQAERVAGLLRSIGLTSGFSPLIVLMGHGSSSENNPHLAAYDCGACSGRHGGPNARIFAAMANSSDIRKLLEERGIFIPQDTWFIGTEHNTCDENIIWYDLDALPTLQQPVLKKLTDELLQVRKMSAHERCRRLASAPVNLTPGQALRHVQERASDFSQIRPELGHATNAAAIIGRRSISHGVFLDRRVFLISYDSTQDLDGSILEKILLAVGPVAAGINLEYYFSTINNEHFGCGSKVPHNITGLFSVMEGSCSDLRTGLPRQMVEIHEPMRLEILVEAKTSVMESIYHRQTSLRELVAGGWVHLSAKDPDSGDIYCFKPGTGFILWQTEAAELPVFNNSAGCYHNQSYPVEPALIRQSEYFGI